MIPKQRSLDNSPQSPLRVVWELISFLLSGLAALALCLACHPQIAEHFFTHFLGGTRGDGGLYVWLVKTFISNPAQALRFESDSLYPYPLTRAWSDSFILPGAVALLLNRCGLTLAASYNLVILLAIALNASFTFSIARRTALSTPLAAAAATVFANSSYFLGNIGHPQLAFFFWIPAAWLCVLPSVSGARAPARRWLLAGACVSGAFYTTVYYAIFAIIGLFVIWFNDLARGISSSRRSLRALLFATVGALPIAYALPPYLSVQRYFGRRGLHEAEHFAARGTSYISHSPLHDLFSQSSSLSHSEAFLSPGYTTLILALGYLIYLGWRRSPALSLMTFAALSCVAISSSIIDSSALSEHTLSVGLWALLALTPLILRRDRSVTALLIAIGVVFLVFSFGPGGNPAKHEPAYAPLGVLYEKVPGLAAIRAVGRFGVVVIFCLTLLAAHALERLCSRLSYGRLCAISLLAIAIGLAENSTRRVPLDTPLPTPQAFNALERIATQNEAVLALPFSAPAKSRSEISWSEFAILNSQYSLWQSNLTKVGFKLINGYSGQRTKLQTELAPALADFPSPSSIEAIAKICNVRWIVLIPDMIPGFEWDSFEASLASLSNSVTLSQRFSDGSAVLAIHPTLKIAQGQAVTVFSTPLRTTKLEISPKGQDPLSISVSSLGREATGATTAITRSDYKLNTGQTLSLSAPRGAPAAAPHVIQIEALTGSGEAVCALDE